MDEAAVSGEAGRNGEKGMRPVEKGEAPEVTFQTYSDAESYLEKRLGCYCSFCEFHISHVPEVEHREAKSSGGEILAWENLLLSCKYCNTRKGTIVKAGDKSKYLWPDEDDTFHVFNYDEDIPKLDDLYLQTHPEMRERAEALFHLVQLDYMPRSPKEKDRRYRERSEARNSAIHSKADWDYIKNTEYAEAYLEQMMILAKNTGFFSVWMSVFQEDNRVKNRLVQAFKGTRQEFCL